MVGLDVVDFGGAIEHSDGVMARLQHRNKHLAGNLGQRIPALKREAGFEKAGEIEHRVTRLGRMTFYRAAVSAGGLPATPTLLGHPGRRLATAGWALPISVPALFGALICILVSRELRNPPLRPARDGVVPCGNRALVSCWALGVRTSSTSSAPR